MAEELPAGSVAASTKVGVYSKPELNVQVSEAIVTRHYSRGAGDGTKRKTLQIRCKPGLHSDRASSLSAGSLGPECYADMPQVDYS